MRKLIEIINESMTISEAKRTDGSVDLYHSTEKAFDILNSDPFTHFGNKKAAIGRIYWMTEYGGHSRQAINHLYCVRFVAKSPLIIQDNSKNHSLADICEYVVRALEKKGIEIEPFFPSEHNIVSMIKDHGFDCLSYRNRAEGGTSYVNISDDNLKSVISHETITYPEVIKLMDLYYPDR